MNKIYIGIDPGKNGGFAIILPDKEPIVKPWSNEMFVHDMRDVATLVERTAIGTDKPLKAIAAVEKVGALPKQGVVSMFSFGQSYGFILGVLSALKIGYQLVPPSVWQREFSLSKAGKQGSIDVCTRLYPNVSLLPTERCIKKSDGMSDATLIATYASRKF